MRIALFSGNYNYVREGANQALNRLVGRSSSAVGTQVRALFAGHRYAGVRAGRRRWCRCRRSRCPCAANSGSRSGCRAQIREDVRGSRPTSIHVSTPDILGTRAQTFARQLGCRSSPACTRASRPISSIMASAGRGRWPKRICAASTAAAIMCSRRRQAIVDEMRALRGDDRVSLWSRGVDRELFDPAAARPDVAPRSRLGDDEAGRCCSSAGWCWRRALRDYVAIVQRLRERGRAGSAAGRRRGAGRETASTSWATPS